MVSATACVCLRGVAGLRLHLDAWLGLEDQPQPLPGQSLVAGYHDGDWLRHRAVPHRRRRGGLRTVVLPGDPGPGRFIHAPDDREGPGSYSQTCPKQRRAAHHDDRPSRPRRSIWPRSSRPGPVDPQCYPLLTGRAAAAGRRQRARQHLSGKAQKRTACLKPIISLDRLPANADGIRVRSCRENT